MYFKKMLGSVVNQTRFKEELADLKDWMYEIIPFKKDRTTLQNRYLRGWVYGTIAKEIWEDTEYVHGVMRLKFLIDRSKKHPYIRSTAKLSTQEFTEYVEKVRNFVAPWLYIPTPEERKKANGLLDDDIEEWHTEC